ncbi:hypothetical protein DID88_003924 [Monilinia fructigena]|uniref:Fumarylacetoacetase-like C-terminal domain-containing protein n=1 Tax=Monilinia fructigena TaxID=38457 RepID=A0A395IUI3_9HELO|nr:hypothetical protein DID88_003924 [Monilinia fructigena]
MPPPSFSRLVRFLAKNGRTYYGDAILPQGVSDIAKATQAKVIEGEIFGKHEVTDQIQDIRLLLAPLATEDVKTVRCLGLNYEQHAKESNMPIPRFPVLFYKPITSLSGPTDPIPNSLNGSRRNCFRLCSWLCRRGDDVSHREWQIQRGGGQWALGKGFDGWAPYGPGIVSSQLIKDPQNLNIFTKLNGKIVQESSTKDMIFGVAKTIAFLSQGTTLLPGDLIFTGTPQGVGMGRKPQVWLKDGDVVEVGLEGVGSIINKVEFTKTKEQAKL